MFTHILLEVYCTKQMGNNIKMELPKYCKSVGKPHYYCLSEKCPYVSFTSHENSLCYINELSEAEEVISFGGDMEINNISKQEAISIWKDIAIKKINEAYEKYNIINY